MADRISSSRGDDDNDEATANRYIPQDTLSSFSLVDSCWGKHNIFLILQTQKGQKTPALFWIRSKPAKYGSETVLCH